MPTGKTHRSRRCKDREGENSCKSHEEASGLGLHTDSYPGGASSQANGLPRSTGHSEECHLSYLVAPEAAAEAECRAGQGVSRRERV